MQVEPLDFVAVPSRDAVRSRRFCGETLGGGRDEHSERELRVGETCPGIREPTPDTGAGRPAFFADPDGNDLMPHHRRAAHD